MKRKLVFFILTVFLATLPVTAQVLSQSTISLGTNGFLGFYGLGISDWDKIFFPSLAGKIEQNFIYVPFNTSNIFKANTFTAGTSLVLDPIPFRLFLLGEVTLNSQKWLQEFESSEFQSTWYDSDNDAQATPDAYRYTNINDYKYLQNWRSQSALALSPGLALSLGPLNLGARYIFQLADNNKRAFEATVLEKTRYEEYNAENIATTSDAEMKFVLNDGSILNGVGAGADLDLTADDGLSFLTLNANGFFTVQLYGGYDQTATTRNHFLGGTTVPDGSTKDYNTSVMTGSVTGGYLSFAGLNQSSTIFTAQSNGRYCYTPADPLGTLALIGGTMPTTINMPQLAMDLDITATVGAFGFLFPVTFKIQNSIGTAGSFVSIIESTGYANENTQNSYSKTTETISFPSGGSNIFTFGIGARKNFEMGDALFQVGVNWDISAQTYAIKINRDVETITKTDNSSPANGVYSDTADNDVQTTRTQDDWYKAIDYGSLGTTFYFPVSFIYKITQSFEFFGGALFRFASGYQSSAYTDSGGFKEDKTVDDNNADPNTNTTLTANNYDPEPVVAHVTTGLAPVLSQTWNCGLRYFFTENLIFTTALCAGAGMPTVNGLFATDLIAEVELRY